MHLFIFPPFFPFNIFLYYFCHFFLRICYYSCSIYSSSLSSSSSSLSSYSSSCYFCTICSVSLFSCFSCYLVVYFCFCCFVWGGSNFYCSPPLLSRDELFFYDGAKHKLPSKLSARIEYALAHKKDSHSLFHTSASCKKPCFWRISDTDQKPEFRLVLARQSTQKHLPREKDG